MVVIISLNCTVPTVCCRLLLRFSITTFVYKNHAFFIKKSSSSPLIIFLLLYIYAAVTYMMTCFLSCNVVPVTCNTLFLLVHVVRTCTRYDTKPKFQWSRVPRLQYPTENYVFRSTWMNENEDVRGRHDFELLLIWVVLTFWLLWSCWYECWVLIDKMLLFRLLLLLFQVRVLEGGQRRKEYQWVEMKMCYKTLRLCNTS